MLVLLTDLIELKYLEPRFECRQKRVSVALSSSQELCVCVQVNPGSLAETAGLRAGDAVLHINNRSSDELEHEQAKQEIVASGNSVMLVVQR